LYKTAKTYQLGMVMQVNGMKLHAGLIGFFGRQGVVQICTYSSDASFTEADAKYQQVAKSFQFDPAFAYDDSGKYTVLTGVLVVGLGVAIAAVIAVVLAVRSSRKSRQSFRSPATVIRSSGPRRRGRPIRRARRGSGRPDSRIISTGRNWSATPQAAVSKAFETYAIRVNAGFVERRLTKVNTMFPRRMRQSAARSRAPEIGTGSRRCRPANCTCSQAGRR
jgi:hypothetical protein